jgi:hypothetical protein
VSAWMRGSSLSCLSQQGSHPDKLLQQLFSSTLEVRLFGLEDLDFSFISPMAVTEFSPGELQPQDRWTWIEASVENGRMWPRVHGLCSAAFSKCVLSLTQKEGSETCCSSVLGVF